MVITPRNKPSDLLGHPRGLAYLCVAEGWERFSFYGMQSLLVLYLTHYLLMPGNMEHVIGFALLRQMIEAVTGSLTTAALSSQIFGVYTGLVYLTPILGGLIADRWLSRTTTVTSGAIMMALGHFLMAFDATFLFAMALLIAGVGCFKGNIAGQVGELYQPDDKRRATAFQVFYIIIATSAIVSPLVCGTLGEILGWHYGFVAAGIGMLIGLAIYWHGLKWLSPDSSRKRFTDAGRRMLHRNEWKTVLFLIAMLPILAASMVGNQQMFNAFVVWGKANFDMQFAGFTMPVTWLLSLDAVVAVACQLFAITVWHALGRRGKEPDDIVKITIGAAIMTSAPFMLTIASWHQEAGGGAISLGWGIAFEVTNEIGFALVAPISLSLFSRAAPKQIQGLMIGVYYLSLFLCNLAVGHLGGLLERMTAANFWLMHAAIVGVSTILLMMVAVYGRQFLTPTVDGHENEPRKANSKEAR